MINRVVKQTIGLIGLCSLILYFTLGVDAYLRIFFIIFCIAEVVESDDWTQIPKESLAFVMSFKAFYLSICVITVVKIFVVLLYPYAIGTILKHF